MGKSRPLPVQPLQTKIVVNTPAFIIRRARAADAEDFCQMMADPDVYSGLLQLPMPSVEMWRKRLADSEEGKDGQLHLVAERTRQHLCGDGTVRRWAFQWRSRPKAKEWAPRSCRLCATTPTTGPSCCAWS